MSDTLKYLTDSIRILQHQLSQLNNQHKTNSAIADFFYTSMANGLGSIIGGALAVLGAFWVYKIQTKGIKRKEEEEYKKKQESKLKYFSMLVKSVAKSTSEMQKNISSVISLIEQDPTNFHPLDIVSLTDFKRISDKLELEDYLIAYEEKSQSEDSVLNFKSIIRKVDDIYYILNLLEGTVNKAGEINSTAHQSLHANIMKIRDIFRALSLNTKISHNTLINLNTFYHKFFTSSTAFDAANLYINFLVPLNEMLVTYLESGTAEDELRLLASYTLEGREIFLNINSENIEFKEILQDDLKILTQWKNELQILTATLN